MPCQELGKVGMLEVASGSCPAPMVFIGCWEVTGRVLGSTNL